MPAWLDLNSCFLHRKLYTSLTDNNPPCMWKYARVENTHIFLPSDTQPRPGYVGLRSLLVLWLRNKYWITLLCIARMVNIYVWSGQQLPFTTWGTSLFINYKPTQMTNSLPFVVNSMHVDLWKNLCFHLSQMWGTPMADSSVANL